MVNSGVLKIECAPDISQFLKADVNKEVENL
jgi:hypothetical protein